MHLVHRFCNGHATAAAEEYQQRYPRRRIRERRVFIRVHPHLRDKSSFSGVKHYVERHVQQNLTEEKKMLLIWYSEVHALVHEEVSAREYGDVVARWTVSVPYPAHSVC
jgi:hypothetical protein